jgi:hypothetical protein
VRWASKREKVARQKNVPTEGELVPTYLETDCDHRPWHSVARIDAERIDNEVTANGGRGAR